MLKVLLVDDEALICQGISAMIEWEKYQLELVGTASNGEIAYQFLLANPVDIVVTDIQMPVMDAIGLIRTCHEHDVQVRFILLTGYREFEYANQAMQYGVKHYILKPTDREELLEALIRERDEILAKREEELKKERLSQKLKVMKPQATEQFWSQYIQNSGSTQKELEFFAENLNSKAYCRCVVFDVENSADYVERFALKCLADELIQPEAPFISTTVENLTVFLVQMSSEEELVKLLLKVRNLYEKFYHKHPGIAVSSRGYYKQASQLFEEAKKCLRYRFYLEPSAVVTPAIAGVFTKKPVNTLSYSFPINDMRIATGSLETMKEQILTFIEEIEQEKIPIEQAKSYILQFYLMLRKYLKEENESLNIREIEYIVRCDSLYTIRSFFLRMVQLRQKGEETYSKTIKQRLAEQMKTIVEENLDNPELNLKWMGKNRLYMSEDYLSKIFSQHTGKRFAHYVTELRIQKAKQIMEKDPFIKMADLSFQTGFDRNAAYFSTVFKNVTGFSPTEYRKMIMSRREGQDNSPQHPLD